MDISCPKALRGSSISYLLILALGGRSLVQFKGLLGQASLPLPLALRAVRAEHGAKVLISAAGKEDGRKKREGSNSFMMYKPIQES